MKVAMKKMANKMTHEGKESKMHEKKEMSKKGKKC